MNTYSRAAVASLEPQFRPHLVAAVTKFAQSPGGEWPALVLEGDLGMGVTANLRSVVDSLHEHQVETMFIDRCSPAIPGHLWLQLARNLEVEEETLSFDASGLRSLRAALVHKAEHTKRLVVAVDDIDQLAELDLALFEDLLVHPPGSGLVILAGMHRRTDSSWQRTHRDRDLLLRRIASNSARRMELTPLTREEMSPFLHAFPGTSEASARFADDLLTFTGGRPDYLIAVLRSLAHIDHAMFEHLLTGSLTLRSLPLPANIVGTVADRLSALRGQTSELIAAIAAIAPAATVARLADVTGTPVDEVDWIIHKLVDNRLARLVGEDEHPSVEPSTPVEGEVAIQSLSFEAQAKLRARAARSLESEIHRGPDTIYAYVRNVLASSLPIGSSEVSATLSAAQLLIEQSRYETARRTIERLIERDGPLHVNIPPIALVQLAEAASRAGDTSASSDLLATATAQAGVDRSTWFSALRRQARDHQAAGVPQDALTIYSYLLNEASLDSLERTHILIEAGATYQLIGDTEQALTAFSAAASLAVSNNNDHLVAEAAWRLGHLKLESGETTVAARAFKRGLRHARQTRDSTVLAHALGALAGGLWHTGRPLTGTKWLAHAVNLAEADGNLASVSALSRRLGWFYMEMGDLPAARKALDESERIDRGFHRMRGLRLVEPQHAVLSALSASGSAAAMSGLETLNDPAQPPVGPEEEALAAFARATLLLYAGDLSRAHEEAMRPFGAQIPAPPMVRLRTLTSIAAICAASVGSVESVDLVLADLRTMPRAAVRLTLFAPIQAYVESIARLIENDWKGAYASAWQAGEAFERTGLILRAATAFDLASRAALQGQLGDKGEIALHRTYALLSGAGISSIPTVGGVCRSADLRKNLRQRGLHLPWPSARQNPPLTERQVEVAVLASRSLSDAAIAAQLQISRRTVTTHMTSILRTTGLRSRLELAGWLNREGIASW